MKYRLIWLLLFVFYSGLAQEVKPITKEEVLAKVQESNNTLKIAKQDVLAAKGDFNQTNALSLIHI